jgi:hypothetical protein
MKRFRVIATWYANQNNWVRLPLDTILAAIAIFAVVAPLLHLDPSAINPRPTLNGMLFAACFSPVFGFANVCLRNLPF